MLWKSSTTQASFSDNLATYGILVLTVLASIWFLKFAFFKRLEVTGSEVRVSTTFRDYRLKSKSLPLSAIAGYRLDLLLTGITLESNDNSPSLVISNKFCHSDEFEAWITSKYEDLSEIDTNNNRQAALENPLLGDTPKQVEQRLDFYSTLISSFTIFNIVICGFYGFYGVSNKWLAWIAISLPVVLAVIIVASKGIVRLKVKSYHPYVECTSLLTSISILSLISIKNHWQLLHDNAAWLPLLVIATALFVLLNLVDKHTKTFSGSNLATFIVCVLYSCSATLNANSLLDSSEPKYHQAQVIKRITSNRLLISVDTVKEVQAASIIYLPVNDGEYVMLSIRKGALGIEYYDVALIEEPK